MAEYHKIFILSLIVVAVVLIPVLTGNLFQSQYEVPFKVNLESNHSIVWEPSGRGELRFFSVSGEFIALSNESRARIYLNSSSNSYLVYESRGNSADFNDICQETCEMKENDESYALVFVIENARLEMDSINYELKETQKQEEPGENVTSERTSRHLMQGFQALRNRYQRVK